MKEDLEVLNIFFNIVSINNFYQISNYRYVQIVYNLGKNLGGLLIVDDQLVSEEIFGYNRLKFECFMLTC